LVERRYDRESAPELERHPAKSGEGLLGAAMQSSAPLLLADLLEDPRAREAARFPVASVLAVPLEGEAAPLGAIAVFTAEDEAPLEETDVGLLRLVAVNVSTAVRLFNASRAREVGERLTAIGRLLSQVIHDFKTPMTVISGYVQLMADADERGTRQEFSELILRQFDVLSAMQREVLEFARGETKIFVRRVYMKKFLSELEKQIRLELGAQPVAVEVRVDSKLVARFDEGRVARALHNLARNALEAMGERGGRLTLGGALEDGELVLTVTDTGPGIPKQIEGRLFQSFVTLGKRGGTGLGLAIVKKIVEEHGGEVQVHSSSEGATFELRLPQARERERAGGAAREQS